jgi:hypothetical protein
MYNGRMQRFGVGWLFWLYRWLLVVAPELEGTQREEGVHYTGPECKAHGKSLPLT